MGISLSSQKQWTQANASSADRKSAMSPFLRVLSEQGKAEQESKSKAFSIAQIDKAIRKQCRVVPLGKTGDGDSDAEANATDEAGIPDSDSETQSVSSTCDLADSISLVGTPDSRDPDTSDEDDDGGGGSPLDRADTEQTPTRSIPRQLSTVRRGAFTVSLTDRAIMQVNSDLVKNPQCQLSVLRKILLRKLQTVERVFLHFDPDGDGFIDELEFRERLRSIFGSPEENVFLQITGSAFNFRHIFSLLDRDDSGGVDPALLAFAVMGDGLTLHQKWKAYCDATDPAAWNARFDKEAKDGREKMKKIMERVKNLNNLAAKTEAVKNLLGVGVRSIERILPEAKNKNCPKDWSGADIKDYIRGRLAVDRALVDHCKTRVSAELEAMRKSQAALASISKNFQKNVLTGTAVYQSKRETKRQKAEREARESAKADRAELTKSLSQVQKKNASNAPIRDQLDTQHGHDAVDFQIDAGAGSGTENGNGNGAEGGNGNGKGKGIHPKSIRSMDDYRKFLAQEKIHVFDADKVRVLFDLYDEDRSGAIGFDEFAQVLNSLSNAEIPREKAMQDWDHVRQRDAELIFPVFLKWFVRENRMPSLSEVLKAKRNARAKLESPAGAGPGADANAKT